MTFCRNCGHRKWSYNRTLREKWCASTGHSWASIYQMRPRQVRRVLKLNWWVEL